MGRRLTVSVFVVGAFVAATVAGFVASASDVEEPTAFGQPARPGEPTYLLDDFEIQYPYIDTVSNRLGDVEDYQRVGVRFSTQWAGGEFPGTATCKLEALTSDGQHLGSRVFQLESLEPSVKGQGWIAVPASEMPGTVGGVCEAGALPDPMAGYLISDPQITESEAGAPRLVADVRWSSAESPGTAYCTATLITVEGSETLSFTLSSGEGPRPIVLLPDRMKDATPQGVECIPFAGSPLGNGSAS